MVTERMVKFDQLILRELSTELLLRFPDKIFSITQLHVSKDLSFAKVWISSVNNVDQLIEDLQSISSELRTYLAKKVKARRVPKLYFVADKTEEKAQEIESILKNIKDS